MTLARIAALDFIPSKLSIGDRLAARILGMDPLIFSELLVADRRYFHTCAWMLMLSMVVAGSGWTLFAMTFYPAAPKWAAYAIGVLVATITAMFDRALTAQKGPAGLRNPLIPAMAFAARLACSVALSLAVSIGVSMVAVAPTITSMQQSLIDKSNESLLDAFDTKNKNEDTEIQNRGVDVPKSAAEILVMRSEESNIQARIERLNQELETAIADEAKEIRTGCRERCHEAQSRQAKIRKDLQSAHQDLTAKLKEIGDAQDAQSKTLEQLNTDRAKLTQSRTNYAQQLKRDHTLQTDPLQAFAMFLTLLRDPKLGEAATQLKLLLFPVILTIEFAFLLVRIGPPPHYRMLYNSIVNRQLRIAAVQLYKDFGVPGSWPSPTDATHPRALPFPAESELSGTNQTEPEHDGTEAK